MSMRRKIGLALLFMCIGAIGSALAMDITAGKALKYILIFGFSGSQIGFLLWQAPSHKNATIEPTRSS